MKPPSQILRFEYKNWRGEVSTRTVRPMNINFGYNEWHPEPQWLMRCWDLDKGDMRHFAMSGIVGPITVVEKGDQS